MNSFTKGNNEIGLVVGYPCDTDPGIDITTETALSTLVGHRNEPITGDSCIAVVAALARLAEGDAGRAMIYMDESCTLPDDYHLSKATAHRYGLDVVAIVVTGYAATVGRDHAMDAILRAGWNMTVIVVPDVAHLGDMFAEVCNHVSVLDARADELYPRAAVEVAE